MGTIPSIEDKIDPKADLSIKRESVLRLKGEVIVDGKSNKRYYLLWNKGRSRNRNKKT